VEKYCRVRQAKDCNMAHAHNVIDNKATNTPSDYATLIALSLLQWLYERASVLHYT
jgi:hypothetical protein